MLQEMYAKNNRDTYKSIHPLLLPPHFGKFDGRSDSIDAKMVADAS
jgi:hypothetical protein